jgi:hypothetical protein
MLNFFKRSFTSQDLADQAQRILSGECRKWDVDNYENYTSKDPRVEDLHFQTLRFGLPETWVKLDHAEKSRLQSIIEQIRKIEVDN